jgi:hypothetical protein
MDAFWTFYDKSKEDDVRTEFRINLDDVVRV